MRRNVRIESNRKVSQTNRLSLGVLDMDARQCGPGSIPAWCHMLVELFAGSHLEFSPRSLIFLPLQDSSQHLIFRIQLDRGPAWKPPKADVVFALNIVNLILKSVKFSTELHVIIIKRKS